MDPITIYTTTITCVFLTTIISKIIARIRVARSRHKGNRSPTRRSHVVSGAPLLAALLTLVMPKKGLQAAIHELHMKMGSVFTVNLLGLKKVTFLVGPEVTVHFFKGSPSEIDFGDTAKVIMPVLGPGVLFGVDSATRNEQIRFCTKAIKPARLPYIYKDPDMYDPCRFGPGREEDKAGGKLSDLSFGAGRYSCLGEGYAFMQIKVIWSYLLRNFDLELISRFPEQEHERILPGPRGEVMVTYRRRSLVT